MKKFTQFLLSSHLISLSMQFRLFNILSSIFLFIRISNFYLRFLKGKRKNDSVFSRVNAFAVNWSYSEETRGIDILIKTSRMQVFIHMFSYSVLPPCLRHCAIHSRRYAGWSRGSSRFSFLVPLSSCLPIPTLVLRGTMGGGGGGMSRRASR